MFRKAFSKVWGKFIKAAKSLRLNFTHISYLNYLPKQKKEGSFYALKIFIHLVILSLKWRNRTLAWGGRDLITLLTPVATKNVDYPRRSWYFSATELLTIAGGGVVGGRILVKYTKNDQLLDCKMLFCAQKRWQKINTRVMDAWVLTKQLMVLFNHRVTHVRIRITFQGLQHTIRRFCTYQFLALIFFGSLTTYLYSAPTYE